MKKRKKQRKHERQKGIKVFRRRVRKEKDAKR